MQRRVRHWLIGLAILALIGLELGLGYYRQQTAIGEALEAGLGRAGRAFEREAAELRRQLQNPRDQALYLARLTSLNDLASTEWRTDDDRLAHDVAREDLESFLHLFTDFLRVQVVDDRGHVRCRLERIGAMGGSVGVASLPWVSLGERTGVVPPAPGAVRVQGIHRDAERLDLAERNRQVITFEAALADGAGTLLLDFFAVPLLERARHSVTVPGGEAYLVDGEGRRVSALLEEEEGLSQPLPPVVRRSLIERGQDSVAYREDRFLATTLETDPHWLLVQRLPERALIGSAVRLGVEFQQTLLLVGVTVIILIIIGVVTLRLSARESQYHNLLEGVGDALLIIEPDSGSIVDTNRAARELVAEGPDIRTLFDLVPPARRSALEEACRRSAGGESIDLHDWRLAADWQERPVDIRLVRVQLGAAPRLQVGMRDLRERRTLEQRLRHAERLSDLGRLTAGVAHEINNPLEGIANYLALLDRSGDDAERRSRYLEMVRQGFDRVRTIVRDLLTFAQPRQPRRERLDLPAVLEDVERIAQYDRGLKGITLENEFPRSLPEVWGDRVGLEQVFLNLILNAGQAMRGAGTLHVRLERVEDGIQIELADTGPGIAPEALERLFDPFFTTRPEGTGLGLAISFGIIGAHGGEIRAANRPEGGAVFRVLLPVEREQVERLSESRESEERG